jgi:hypothetical protein
MALFQKAVAKQESAKASAPKKKSTVWLVEKDSAESEAVSQLVELTGQSKAIEARMGVFKSAVKSFGEESYVRDFAFTGVSPETPMVVQNEKGEKVTFVVQDRSAQYDVKLEQQEALASLLGEDRAKELLFTEVTFGFNRDVLALPGVQEVIEAALERAVKKLMDDSAGKPLLTPEQAELLLDVKQKTAFKPGTLERLSLICGKDVVKIQGMLEIMGSSATRYVKC